MQTLKQLIGSIHETVTKEGMTVSPSDIGHIISLFLEGLVHSRNSSPTVNNVLQSVADECGSVTDE